MIAPQSATGETRFSISLATDLESSIVNYARKFWSLGGLAEAVVVEREDGTQQALSFDSCSPAVGVRDFGDQSANVQAFEDSAECAGLAAVFGGVGDIAMQVLADVGVGGSRVRDDRHAGSLGRVSRRQHARD